MHRQIWQKGNYSRHCKTRFSVLGVYPQWSRNPGDNNKLFTGEENQLKVVFKVSQRALFFFYPIGKYMASKIETKKQQ